jgi:hypothetical protein
MAIFYQPPEPRQAYPKVLPQTQGAQPKPAGPLGGSVNALTAVGVWATLAAVPMPVQKPLNVVPLTLKYGSQPAPQPRSRWHRPTLQSVGGTCQYRHLLRSSASPRSRALPRLRLSCRSIRRIQRSDSGRKRIGKRSQDPRSFRSHCRAGILFRSPRSSWDHRSQLAGSVGATVCSVERPRCRPVGRAQRPAPAIGVGLGTSGTAPACCDRHTNARARRFCSVLEAADFLDAARLAVAVGGE